MAKRTQEKKERILRHGFALQRIFPATKSMGPVSLVEALQRLEKRAHKLAEDECNRPLPEGYADRVQAKIERELDALLDFKRAKVPVFVNGDPRGYALKIEDGYVRDHNLDIHRDWGGYGILCPEF